MTMRTTISLSLALALVSAVSWAKQSDAVHHRPAANLKARHARATTDAVVRLRTKRRHPATAHANRRRPEHRTAGHAVARRERHAGRQPRRLAMLPPQDRYVGGLHPVGHREVGEAAWYGPRFLGKRTASGERLDTIHATAAHRWLPLHSLVRITNLRNGRSAVAVINDRGPYKRRLLIDLSPRTARELHMIEAGIVPVVIVPVAEPKRQAR
jgi:rare lipoprotein A (peptidoglycan hydrolase)